MAHAKPAVTHLVELEVVEKLCGVKTADKFMDTKDRHSTGNMINCAFKTLNNILNFEVLPLHLNGNLYSIMQKSYRAEELC